MFRSTQPTKRCRLGWLPLSIAAAVALWLIYPQLKAFPEHGTVTEREAWARLNVPQYMSLTRTVEKIPQIQESVGSVTAIAPASGQRQVTALPWMASKWIWYSTWWGIREPAFST
jgi:hypothetical protein